MAGAVSIAAAAAAPARAEYVPRPEQLRTAGEEKLADEIVEELIDNATLTPEAALAKLDAMLARLRRPTVLRGYVQLIRAQLLLDQNDFVGATEAVDESVRLLPGYSGPLIIGSQIYSYTDRVGQAADYLLRASEIDPAFVREVSEYDINNLSNRLVDRDETRRLTALSERLLAIGWKGEGLAARSRLAVRTIEERIRTGQIEAARTLIPKLVTPGDARRLLINNRYKAVWPDVEAWAGPRLERQWQVYLTEVRAAWLVACTPTTARPYASALAGAGHYETLVREFLPLFSQPIDKDRDWPLIFLAGEVGTALAKLGRWQEIGPLFAAAQKVWPLGSSAIAMNLQVDRAGLLHSEGRPAEALAALEAALKDGERWGSEVNRDATVGMHRFRACLLHDLGRDSEGALSRAMVLAENDTMSIVRLHLCMDEPDKARRALLAGLENEHNRHAVLIFLQHNDAVPTPGETARRSRERAEALRADPAVQAAAAAHGRILPYSYSDGAPPEARP